MSKSDTKAFWKTSHKYSNKKDNPDIDLDKKKLILKKKRLNACAYGYGEEETDDIDINEVSNNPIYDEILNGAITDLDEVYEAK